MPAAPIPKNEELRLAALREYDILDTPPESSFDRVTRLACQLLNVPMSVVSLVDKERQWFKSCVGIDVTETHRAPSFCSYTILTDRYLNVPDATKDSRFCDSTLVTGSPYLRFYLGIPLRSSSGFNIGSFCAMSTEAKVITEAELQTARDLAAIVTSELELRLALKHLQENHSKILHLEKMSSIGRLASGVAHEINTPLQFIGDNTQFLKDSFGMLSSLISSYDSLVKKMQANGLFPDECASIQARETEIELPYLAKEIPVALDQSQEGISRVHHLIGAMKTFSAPAQCEKQNADLNQAVEASIAVSQSEWKSNSDLITNLASDLPLVPCILGDLSQVILHLIDNSVDSIQDAIDAKLIARGVITIKTANENGRAVIIVEDNGHGIPEEIVHKIFDPFFTTKQIGQGTGQGLAISYDIVVNKHQGAVNVTSKPRHGASFRISLPLEKSALH